jgi:integrase
LPRLKPSSEQRYHVSIRALRRQFDGKYLDEVARGEIAAYVSSRVGVTDATIRRDLACLQSMFTRAIGWGWITGNPVAAYDRKGLKEAERRQRYLSPTEVQKLADTAPSWLKPIIMIAAGTGMRLGEILALRWADIDFEKSEIAVRESKSGQPRRVPTSPSVSAQFPAQGQGFVFQRSGGRPLDVPMVSNAFQQARKASGIAPATFHDLRHTFASWAVQAGMDLYRVGKILGHKGPQTTQRYAHLRTADLREIVEVVGTKLGTKQMVVGTIIGTGQSDQNERSGRDKRRNRQKSAQHNRNFKSLVSTNFTKRARPIYRAIARFAEWTMGVSVRSSGHLRWHRRCFLLVVPAKAGIQSNPHGLAALDSRFRGNDDEE